MIQPQDIRNLGRYEILSKLGEGGMASVFKATDSFLKRTVALKVARISSLDLDGPGKNTIDQCLKEARLAAQFIHPNIVITYDAGIENDFFYLTLEYIDGEGLQAHRRKGRLLPQSQILEIIYNICYALDYIHQKKYAHLDIKPSNIMLSKRGEVKLMDFGVSRFLKEEPKKGTQIVGTPYYMSPEQSSLAGDVDHRSDIFSLGVVFYELLSGKRPFEGKDFRDIITKIAKAEPVSIREHIPEISSGLESIIKKTMRKKKSRRFNSARELAEALQPFIKGQDSRVLDEQDEKKITYLKRLPFFKHFQHSDLMDVIKISSWSFHDKDSWIIKQDDHDNNIYFVIQGSALLHLEREVKPLEPGDCFGETAILYKMSRKATVSAKSNCLLMTINANILKQSSDAIQVKFLREFYNNKILQLIETNLKLIRARH